MSSPSGNQVPEDAAKTLSQMNAAEGKKAPDASGKIRKPRFKRVEHKYTVEPRVIQVIKKPKTYMDHTYRDFSQVPPELDYSHPTEIDDMAFSQKVHDMLSDEALQNWITWMPHGRCFKILVPKRLEQSKTLIKYFGHNRYSSFLRQLNNHGFRHLTQGTDRNGYYHECMLRGLPHLTTYMPPGRDARRLIPDPDNEPDFYQIERLFPLPVASTNIEVLSADRLTALGTSAPEQLSTASLFGGMQQLDQSLMMPQGVMAPQQMQQMGRVDMGLSNNIGTGFNPNMAGQLGNHNPYGAQQRVPDNAMFAALLQQQQFQQQQFQQQPMQQQQQQPGASNLRQYF